jgi:iron complex transport system permease protein
LELPTLSGAEKNRGVLLTVLAVLAVIFFVLDIMLGSVEIPFREVFRIIFLQKSDNQAWLIHH